MFQFIKKFLIYVLLCEEVKTFKNNAVRIFNLISQFKVL